ncbi:MAG TPA: hypothetical protein VD790_05390 [Thermoleophilaceae bacterium]|nr:hypothetical protein [Thermoleophilaceae bacterium]
MNRIRRPSRSVVVLIVVVVAASLATAGAATKVLISSSSQVENGALKAKDLSKKARQSLKGKRGKRGRAGEAGATGATGATGPRGPSDAFTVHETSFNTDICPQPGGCTADTVLTGLNLEPGSYVINTAVTIHPIGLNAGDKRAIECELENGGSPLERSNHNYEAGTTATLDETIHVNTAITLSSAGLIQIRCSVSAGTNFQASGPRMTAIQVASLTEQ